MADELDMFVAPSDDMLTCFKASKRTPFSVCRVMHIYMRTEFTLSYVAIYTNLAQCTETEELFN